MVNDVRELMQRAAAAAPEDRTDLGEVLRGGRQRARRRRRTTIGALAAVVAVTAGVGTWTWQGGADGDRVANNTVPRPEGPVLRLSDAVPGVEGTDYDVLSSHTNKDLNTSNGQYYEGVTEDGLILLHDGPRGVENTERYALLDPATGDKTWLPDRPGTEQVVALELSTDRLVFASAPLSGSDERPTGKLGVELFDRSSKKWTTVTWPWLPAVSDPFGARIGPDGRLYVGAPATNGEPPPGGWPTGPDGEVDDAAAEGDTYHLWSVSLTDPTDVRNEKLRVGSFAFADDALVWTETTNGINNRIHVRELSTGAERDFDPHSGKRCNLLGFGASGDRIALSQYCGTYDNGRDDRIQVLSTDGEQITTIQGDDLGGGFTGAPNSGLVTVSSYHADEEGTYVYEAASGRLLRVSDSMSLWAGGGGGPMPPGYLQWDTAYGEGAAEDGGLPGMDQGATQWLVRWH